MEYTTRRSAQRAIDTQPVNGFGVRLLGGFVVFRPYRDRWELAEVGKATEHRFFDSSRSLLDRVFTGEN